MIRQQELNDVYEKVKEALESAQINPSGNVRKNIGIVLGNVGGSKSSHEFYSRLNYVVVEKVLRGMGAKEDDVQTAVAKYKAHFPEWRLDSFKCMSCAKPGASASSWTRCAALSRSSSIIITASKRLRTAAARCRCTVVTPPTGRDVPSLPSSARM